MSLDGRKEAGYKGEGGDCSREGGQHPSSVGPVQRTCRVILALPIDDDDLLDVAIVLLPTPFALLLSIEVIRPRELVAAFSLLRGTGWCGSVGKIV
jgi:hypothetical protein